MASKTADLNKCNKQIKEYLFLRERQEQLSRDLGTLKYEILKALDGCETGESDSHKVHFNSYGCQVFDRKRFMEDHPEIDYSPYLTDLTSSVLKVKEL